MKILFAIAHLGKGGGQVTQSVRLIKEISKNHETTLITLKFPNSVVSEPCKTIYAGDLKFPKGVYDMWKIIRKIRKQYDVIQCFDGYYAVRSDDGYGSNFTDSSE